ncbi:MAG TPA: TRAP transporter large permease subunit [Desulfobacteraceae bacterium]|nr:TRAP transporter large permease subunit [Desulfobacteraceae bacterium]
MITAALILIVILSLLGLPLFLGLFGVAALGLYSNGVNYQTIFIEVLRLADAPLLLAIPLFTFAGYLLAHGGTSRRVVRLSQAFFGWLPGGLAVVALVTAAFFTAITGATGITVIALGGLLLPALIEDHYTEEFSLGLVTISGSLGLHFPPSLPVILFGFVSGVSIRDLFVAGVVPGLLILALCSVFAILVGKKWKILVASRPKVRILPALKEAAWEIAIPGFVLAGIYTGIVTATEASAFMVVYVLIVKVVVFKELSLRTELVPIMVESMKMVGAIMVILAASLALTNYLVDAFVPMKLLHLIQGLVKTQLGFLIALNLFLILVGCMMDIFSAILVVVPLIMPLAKQFGVHPVHLGVLFLANLAIGYNTPPVGLNLFIASGRFEQPITRVYRAALPFLLVLFISLFLITYFPSISLIMVNH